MPPTGWDTTGGEAWASATVSFLVMWVAMTVAMMLPSIAPTLWRYRQGLASEGHARAVGLAALAGAAYLVVWAAVGVIVFVLGVAFAAVQLSPALARAAPIGAGVVVLVAGGVQLTRWKARHLAHVRAAPTPGHRVRAGAGSAWRHGLRLGRDCGLSCAGPMASLLVVGVMDLRAMAIVTVAITAERLAPAGERTARAIGLGAIVAGFMLIARAAALGLHAE